MLHQLRPAGDRTPRLQVPRIDRHSQMPCASQTHKLYELLKLAHQPIELDIVWHTVFNFARPDAEDHLAISEVMKRLERLSQHNRVASQWLSHMGSDLEILGHCGRVPQRCHRLEHRVGAGLAVDDIDQVLSPDRVGIPAHEVVGPPH